jgi:hypothetical protein
VWFVILQIQIGMKHFCVWVGLLFCIACANPVPPSGGPKDTRPPILIRAIPDTFSTEVNVRDFRLQFDEWIVLKNAQKEVLISPRPTVFPEIKMKGKGIAIQWKDSLQPNRTYQINFGGAIADFNEGNVATGIRYVFSTGALLDSGKVSFVVKDAFTLEPLSGVGCMLYFANSKTDPTAQLPDYVGFSDAQGRVTLTYLPNDTFYVFALWENNVDYLWNSPAEKVGFLPNKVATSEDFKATILLYNEKPEKNRPIGLRDIFPGKSYLRFLAPVDSLKISVIPDSLEALLRYEWGGETQDSLVLWWGKNIPDSVRYVLASENMLDTLLHIPQKPRVPSKQGAELPYNRQKYLQDKSDFGDSICFLFEHPLIVKTLQPSALLLGGDTLERIGRIGGPSGRTICFDVSGALLSEEVKWIPYPNSLEDIFGNALKEDTLSKKLHPLVESQVLSLQLEGIEESILTMPLLLELQVAEKRSYYVLPEAVDGAVHFETKLPVGSYKVRIIVDRNANHRWDGGEYKKGLQPERIISMPGVLQIRAGFDMFKRWSLSIEE